MANDWHYALEGQQAAGPVSVAQLKQLVASGQLKPADLVWQEGMTGWMPAASVKGLFPPGTVLSDSTVMRVTAAPKAALPRKTDRITVPRDWANTHPLAVLALTVVTGGVFGLFYVYQVCRGYAARAAGRRMDAAGRALGRVRHPLAVLVLSYLTLGVYFCYWASRALVECGEYAGRKDVNARAELSLMLIAPPYALYVAVFELPQRIRAAQALAGVPETPGLRQSILFVNPCLYPVLPVLAMMYQDALNQVWLAAP